MNEGISDIEDIQILSTDPFRQIGSPITITKMFGGKTGYLQAIKQLENEIYIA